MASRSGAMPVEGSKVEAEGVTLADLQSAAMPVEGPLADVARVAKPITKNQTLDLESAVSKALGRSVTVDVEVDPALIGGLQLKMGSRLVDASIRTKLNNLTNLMKGA